jgi:hypothetical protein
MSVLNSKFDVLRGWPNGQSVDACFAADNGASTLSGGDIVVLTATGVAWADTASTPKAVFVVVEGNDDFSAQFVGKVNCLRNSALLRVSNYVTGGAPGTFAVGTDVTYDSTGSGTGKWAAAQSGEQVIGEVWAIDATNATLDIFFHGGRSTK